MKTLPEHTVHPAAYVPAGLRSGGFCRAGKPDGPLAIPGDSGNGNEGMPPRATGRAFCWQTWKTMPLDLLDKVFGKLSYTLEFTEDQRFTVQIAVLYLRFTAQGNWSTENEKMTLVYDAITGFEKLWWLGGFDFLTHCDTEHTLTETVPYSMTDDRLIFYSNGADLIFAR